MMVSISLDSRSATSRSGSFSGPGAALIPCAMVTQHHLNRSGVAGMATITFDTLKFVEKLKSGGIPEDQAKVISEAFRDASGEAELITKKDLQIELAPVRSDINLIKWMMGILLGGVMALLLKSFFPA
jgi:hypothetical protein